MSSITLKQMLGTENIGQSRSVINSNSTITENAINLLKGYIDTDIAGGKLEIGSINVPIGANTLADTLFTLGASGTVAGNFTIDGTLSVTQDLDFTGSSLFKNALVVDGSGASSVFTLGGNGDVDLEHIEGLFVETQFGSTTPVTASTVTSGGDTWVPSTITRIMYLDYTNYVNADGTNGAYKVSLAAGSKIGERMYLRVSTAHADLLTGGSTAQGVIILNNNIHADWQDNFAAGQVFSIAGTALVDIQRQWINFVWTGTAWQVEDAHPSVLGF